MSKTLLVTGGAGFIGSNFVQLIVAERPGWRIVNLDALTYAGNLENLTEMRSRTPNYTLRAGRRLPGPAEVASRRFDACGERAACRTVVHFAAESHVDRSIESAGCPS